MRNDKWEMEIFNYAHCGYKLTEKDFFVSLCKKWAIAGLMEKKS